MPKPRPSTAIKSMLVERDIALWDAYHYQTPSSTGRHANSKDPVRVALMTPHAIDRMFYGAGPTVDEAIVNALATNSGLNFHEPGLTGALARLENECHALSSGLWSRPGRWSDIDDDIPF